MRAPDGRGVRELRAGWAGRGRPTVFHGHATRVDDVGACVHMASALVHAARGLGCRILGRDAARSRTAGGTGWETPLARVPRCTRWAGTRAWGPRRASRSPPGKRRNVLGRGGWERGDFYEPVGILSPYWLTCTVSFIHTIGEPHPLQTGVDIQVEELVASEVCPCAVHCTAHACMPRCRARSRCRARASRAPRPSPKPRAARPTPSAPARRSGAPNGGGRLSAMRAASARRR